MPVSRDLAVDLATEVAQLYLDAQRSLVDRAASKLRDGIEAPDWLEAKLGGLQDLELSARRVMEDLESDMRKAVAKRIAEAYEKGGQAAAAELSQYLSTAASLAEVPQQAAIQRLVRSAVTRLSGTHLPVLRSVMDAYREAVASGGAGDVLTGVSTRRQATQRAWSRLLDQGITSFTDRLGRRQNLASYAEMSMRTSVAQAAVEGHLDKLAANDLDLVVVSNSSQECDLCRPWEGKILSRSGRTGSVLAENPATGEMVQVEIAGTLDQAVADGLFHPSCRHSVSAYFPGLTEIPTNTADPAGDASRQRLRALERRVRRLETQKLGALDDAARDHYGKLASKARADIKAHVSGDTNLFRKRERERPNLGLKRQAARPTDRPPIKAAKKAATKKPPIKKPTAPPIKAPAKKVAKPVVKKAAPPPKVAKPKVSELTPAQRAARHNESVGNPTELTGNAQGNRWLDSIPNDTGVDNPIPIRDLEIARGYTIASGQAWRVKGVTYLIEDRPLLTRLPNDEVFRQFREIHASIPDAQIYQRGYAWLARRSPNDAYWEEKFNRPGFTSLASAGDEGVRVWGRSKDLGGPKAHIDTLNHEFGHNVSTAAKRHRPPLDDSSEAWESAVYGESLAREPLDWAPSDRARREGLIFGQMRGRVAPRGVTEYGTSSEGENYAESMMFYLFGSIGFGRLRPGGPLVPLYFRDIWPKRAALFDRLFPDVARKQREAIALRAA